MIENIVENCYNVHIAVSTANIDAKELGIMRFTIRGKNIEVTEGLRSAVTEKLGKLEKYFTPETEIIVTLIVEKDRQKIEVTIPVKGNIIRSEQVSNDMYVSIDLVEEVIERQLRKYKTKIIGKHKDGGRRGSKDHPYKTVRYETDVPGRCMCTDGTARTQFLCIP